MRKFILSILLLLLAATPLRADLLKADQATTVRVVLTNASTGAAITGITITNLSIRKVKHSNTTGATTENEACAASGTDHDCVEIGNGVYEVEIPADNVDTAGRFDICPVYTTVQAVAYCRTHVVLEATSWALLVDGNTISLASIRSEFDDGLDDYDVAKFAEMLQIAQLSLRSDSAVAADLSSMLNQINANTGSGAGSYANTTDSGQAVQDSLVFDTIPKNAAYNNFMFKMVLSSDNKSPATGKTVAATRSGDGGAFSSGTLGSITEVANGWYRLNIPAADLNFDEVILRFTATDTNTVEFKIRTQR